MAVSVTVNDIAQVVDLDAGVRVSRRLASRGTAEFALLAPASVPVVGQTCGVFDAGVRIFGGIINEITRELRGSYTGGQVRYRCLAISWEFRLDRRLIVPAVTSTSIGSTWVALSSTVNTSGTTVTRTAGDYFDKNLAGTQVVINAVTYTVSSVTSSTVLVLTATAGVQTGVTFAFTANHGNIARSIITNFADGENITFGTVESGSALDKVVYDHVRVADALDELATSADKVWYLNPDLELYFIDRATVAAATAITTANAMREGYEVRETAEDLSNWHHRHISYTAFDPETDTFTGDASTKTWYTDLPINTVQSMSQTVSGATLETTFGVRGVDTGKDFYYAYGEKKITQDATTSKSVSDATNATPIEVTTTTAHGLVDGHRVTVASVGGNTGANGTFRIRVTATDKFELIDSAGTGSYTSGGTVSANGPIATGDTLTVISRALGGDWVSYDDGAAIAAQAVIEGTSGRYETAEEDTANVDAVGAAATCQAIVSDRKNAKASISFVTEVQGFDVGQLLDLTNATLNCTDTYLIQQIDAYDVAGQRLRYRITAVDGNGVDGWREYFRRLARNVGVVGSGSSGTSVILRSSGAASGGGYRTLTISASAITPVAAAEQTQVVTLTGNITINAPSGSPTAGDLLTLQFTQDGTGGRTLTWNSTYKVDSIGTVLADANTYSTFDFVYTGSAWRLRSLPAIGLPV